MSGTQLTPEKITSPFQLMAAWFSMLVLLVSVLLVAAANIAHPDWAAGFLVIFSSLMVLLVIACVILMLTKFRPHLQEGKEYAEWLKDQNTYSPGYLIKKIPELLPSHAEIKSSRFTSNLRAPDKSFLIEVVNRAGSFGLVEKLNNLGFNAKVYEDPANRKFEDIYQQESIWVGSRLDPKAVIQAIKLAVTQWPELKYLHLSSDQGGVPDESHEELFFGGSSSAAKRYGLQEWGKDELLSLDEQMPIAEFHSAIRAKYS